MTRRLPHYVKHERKRAGLAQADVAYLLGVHAPSKVVRYEGGRHLPPLKTALAYEALFGIPVAELFPGTVKAVRKQLQRRAKRWVNLLERLPQTPRLSRRQRSLEKIIL